MIKLKNILTEAGVFDSPDTYSTGTVEKPTYTQSSTADGDIKYPDFIPEEYKELFATAVGMTDEQKQEAVKQLNMPYGEAVTKLAATHAEVYAKEGVLSKFMEDVLNPKLKIAYEAWQKIIQGQAIAVEDMERVLSMYHEDPDGEFENLRKHRSKQLSSAVKDKEVLDKAKKEPKVQSIDNTIEKKVKSEMDSETEVYFDEVGTMTNAIKSGQSAEAPDSAGMSFAKGLMKTAKSIFGQTYSTDPESGERTPVTFMDRIFAEPGDKTGAAAPAPAKESKIIKLKNILEADDINLSKVFMKGVGPGGEPNPDQLTDEPEKELEDAFKELDKEIKRTDLEPKKVDEALGLTLAGVALSMPAIIMLIGKFVNILKRIPGLKSLSGDKLIAIGDKWHHKITGGIEFALKKVGVKDPVRSKKFANIIYHTILAILLVAGGGAAFKALGKGNIAGATLKGALNAVKSSEIRSFLVTQATKIA